MFHPKPAVTLQQSCNVEATATLETTMKIINTIIRFIDNPTWVAASCIALGLASITAQIIMMQ
jgi:hypothetical protein